MLSYHHSAKSESECPMHIFDKVFSVIGRPTCMDIVQALDRSQVLLYRFRTNLATLLTAYVRMHSSRQYSGRKTLPLSALSPTLQ